MGRRQQLFHITDAYHAKLLENGIIHAVGTSQGTGMGGSYAAPLFTAARLEHHHRLALQGGGTQPGQEFGRLGHAFEVKADDLGVLVFYQIGKVVFHAHDRTVTGRDGVREAHGRAVHQGKAQLAALGDDAHGAGPVTFRRDKGKGRDLVHIVHESRTVGTHQRHVQFCAQGSQAAVGFTPFFRAHFGVATGVDHSPASTFCSGLSQDVFHGLLRGTDHD